MEQAAEQSATERFVLRRQNSGTIYRQKWRHQRHCRRHLNINVKLIFFTFISRHVIYPYFPDFVTQWLQCFCICSLSIFDDVDVVSRRTFLLNSHCNCICLNCTVIENFASLTSSVNNSGKKRPHKTHCHRNYYDRWKVSAISGDFNRHLVTIGNDYSFLRSFMTSCYCCTGVSCNCTSSLSLVFSPAVVSTAVDRADWLSVFRVPPPTNSASFLVVSYRVRSSAAANQWQPRHWHRHPASLYNIQFHSPTSAVHIGCRFALITLYHTLQSASEEAPLSDRHQSNSNDQ